MRRLALALFLLLAALPARAADSTVTALTAASALGGTELLYCVQGGADRKCTPAQLATYFQSLVSGDCTLSAGVITCTKVNGNAIPSGAADDQILVGSAANTFQLKTVPDCTDSGGNHLNYTQATNTFSCGTSSSGGGGSVTAGPAFIAADWLVPGGYAVPAAGVAAAANVIRCVYGAINQKVTISDLGSRVTTLSVGSNTQLALYTNVSGRPGALLSNTASISTTSAGTVSAALGANKQIGPGGSDGGADVWLCANQDSAVPALLGQSPSNSIVASMLGSATLGSVVTAGSIITGISCTGAACNGGVSTFGTWPTLTGSTWTDTVNATAPFIVLKAVSVP